MPDVERTAAGFQTVIPGCEKRTLLKSTSAADDAGQGLLDFYQPPTLREKLATRASAPLRGAIVLHQRWSRSQVAARFAKDGDQRVGRIMLAQQAPEGLPWFWTIERFMQSTDDHGYAASREQAIGDFELRWDASHPPKIPQPAQPIDLTSKVYGQMPVLLQPRKFDGSLGNSPPPNDDPMLINSVSA